MDGAPREALLLFSTFDIQTLDLRLFSPRGQTLYGEKRLIPVPFGSGRFMHSLWDGCDFS